jgi:VanZ family protein
VLPPGADADGKGPRALAGRAAAWLPALGWAGVLFVLSSFPGSVYPQTRIPAADKMVHLALYGMLGALCGRALMLRRRRSVAGRPVLLVVVAAALLATLFGVSDELHQLFVPGRSADWHDAVADALGAVVGAAVAVRVWASRDSPR